MANENANGNYDAAQIVVLEGLEAVRKRPGMYIGSTSPRGLHHLVWEIVDNSIDEALAGHCDTILVSVHSDQSVTIQDNGRGFPVDIHEKTGLPAVTVALTILHAGGKFNGEGYKVSGGLHGVGASVVNALSERFEVLVRRNNKLYRQTFSRGIPLSDLEIIGESTENGSTVTFLPDHEIFTETIELNYETLQTRLRELAFLNKGVKITLTDERIDRTQVFQYEGGVKSFVDYLNRGKDVLHEEPVYIQGERDTVTVEIALQYNDSYTSNIFLLQTIFIQ